MEVIKNIFDIYIYLSEKGINVLSIILTLLIINYLKENIFIKIKIYNEKYASIINIIAGMILSIILSTIFYICNNNLNIIKIIITSMISSAVSVYSNEIIKNIRKIIDNKNK